MTTNPAVTADRAALREAARAYLDAESEPAYSWVIESQAARAEGRPNREVERMERIARARVALEEALAATPAPEAPTGPTADVLRDLRAEVADLGFAFSIRTVLNAIDAALAAQPEPSAPEHVRDSEAPDKPTHKPEPSAPEGLDVDRLARATERVFGGVTVATRTMTKAWPSEVAAAIAAAYREATR